MEKTNYKTNTALLEAMQEIVNTYVSLYKTDFESDKSSFHNLGSGCYKWIVREHGTHLIKIYGDVSAERLERSIEYLDAVKQCYSEYREYFVNLNPDNNGQYSLTLLTNNLRKEIVA